MKQSVNVNITAVFITSLTSFAFANYDKQCDISFHSYASPSIAGYIFSTKNQANCHSNFQAGV